MSDSKKSSVGIIILTELDGVPYAALARRGKHKIELDEKSTKRFLPETYPGVSQPTVHGGQTEAEKVMPDAGGITATLIREIIEETNLDPARILRRGRIVQISENEFRHSTVLAAFIDIEEVAEIKFEPCKSLNLVSIEDLGNIRIDPRPTGFWREGIAMFPDDKEALVEAFRRFDELKALAEGRRQ